MNTSEQPLYLRSLVSGVLSLHPGYSPRALKARLALALHMRRHWPALRGYLQRMHAALGAQGLARLGGDAVGVVHWPYISKAWEAPERLAAVASHYERVLRHCPRLLLLQRDQQLTLCSLADASPGCSLVLDRAIWFRREGELVLNLFQGELRVASLAFSLGSSAAGLCLWVGAVQGIHKGIDSQTSLEIYRDLTKDFEGLRPRSLLIEALKCLARSVGAVRIYAVADQYRHHRHAYFGQDKAAELAANYDVIWQEHGATPAALAGFFELPLAAAQRAAEDIAPKKRAMYRRRQALLEQMYARLAQALTAPGSL